MSPETMPAPTQAGQETLRANGDGKSFTARDAARLYQAHHLVPIPWRAVNGRKAPTIKAWNDPSRRPSFERLLAEWNDGTQIGLATEESRLVVVDVDVKSATPGEPAPFVGTTPAVARTPSGGWHFFYRRDSDVPIPSRAGVRAGVDMRADDGYVAVWPSKDYRFEPAALVALLNVDRLPAFSSVAHVVAPNAEVKQTAVATEPWIAKALSEPVPLGVQREVLVKLAGYFIKQRLPVDIIVATLWPRVRTWPQRAEDPWMEAHVRELVDDLLRRDRERRPVRKFETVPVAEVVRRAHEQGDERVWLCEGWLPENALLLVAGPSHVGKTWLMTDLAVSVATGLPFLGRHDVKQGSVVFVAAEDDEKLLGRRVYYSWFAKVSPDAPPPPTPDGTSATFEYIPEFPEGIPLHVHAGNGLRFGTPQTEDEFLARARELKPRLIVLDPLKDLVDGKALEKFFASFVERLPRLRQLQRDIGSCAVAVVHHVGKDAERQGTDAATYGSSLFNASFDTRWIIEEVAGGMALTRKIKGVARPADVYLRYAVDGERLRFTEKEIDDDERAQLKSQNTKDQAILAAIREAGEIGMNDLLRAVKSRGITGKSTLTRRLDWLKRHLLVVQDPTSKKWKLGLEDSEVS